MALKYDIAIIGGGSAGVCAALAAAETNPDASILLVEKENILGGTSTIGGVHNWEPTIAVGRFHIEIARRLLSSGEGCVGKDSKKVSQNSPYAVSDPCDDPYESTLRRAGIPTSQHRRFHFKGNVMARAMEELLAEHSNITVKLNTKYIRAETSAASQGGLRHIERIVFKTGGIEETVEADYFIDSSANIILARDIGCSVSLGSDPKSAYAEPSAPDSAQMSLNAVTLLFQVGEKTVPGVDPVPEDIKEVDVSRWANENFPRNRPVSFVTRYPKGGLWFNMLPTMEGVECFQLSPDQAYKICKARVYRYFEWLQRDKDTANLTILSLSPRLGVRESYRLKARYVLSEKDILLPFGTQPLSNEIIAYADHALDIHGAENKTGGVKELLYPYGIPYSCLLPQEADNLLVACRGSGFSHIAASSCRLTRTVMGIGEAAGVAAGLCDKNRLRFDQINPKDIRETLGISETEKEIPLAYAMGTYNRYEREV